MSLAKLPPPRKVWIVWSDDRFSGGIVPASASTRKRAAELIEDPGERVVGPFIRARKTSKRRRGRP